MNSQLVLSGDAYRMIHSRTENVNVVRVNIVRDTWKDGVFLYSTIIQEVMVDLTKATSEVILNLQSVEEKVKKIDLNLKRHDCKHVAVISYDEPDGHNCTLCGNPAAHLVRTNGSSLLEHYCSKCVPTPMYQQQTGKIFERLVDSKKL